MLLFPSSGTLWLPNHSVAEFTLPTRRLTSWMFLAAMTAARPSAGYTWPSNDASRGTRLSRPSGSGAALRNPDAPAAFVNTGRLQTTPVA